MRQPTPLATALAWHRQALEDASLHLEITLHDEPECGWFKTRLVKDGPWVAARIWWESETDDAGELVSDEVMRCEINGDTKDPGRAWLSIAGHPITEREFNYMEAVRRHAGWYEPHLPQANPRQRVDWSKVPTPQF